MQPSDQPCGGAHEGIRPDPTCELREQARAWPDQSCGWGNERARGRAELRAGPHGERMAGAELRGRRTSGLTTRAVRLILFPPSPRVLRAALTARVASG